MDLATTVAGKVVDLSMNHIIRQTGYIFCYKSKAQNLELKVQDLIAARERVQSSVNAATRKGEEILQNVKNWQDRASMIAQEPENGSEVEGESNKDKAKCFFGLCPNLKSRYELSKKADEQAGAIVKLLEQEGKIHGKVSHPFDMQEIWAPSSKSYVALESRKFMLNEILGALKDANLERIGVYGKPGVGKTTLIKQVATEAKADKLFDVVALAVVTKTPDVRKIQGEIADFLGLKFDEESVAGRAIRLSIRLRKESKILVILDDIWTSLKLDEVGIAFGDHEHRGCKVLITSKDPYVLHGMHANRHFRVDALKEEEAWYLFKKTAGDIVEDPHVQSKATDTCRRCAGLPIAIVATAKALKYRTPPEWENALKQLKNPSQTMPADPRSAIELSFNHLANEDLKSAFLLCSLMPYNATIFDLLKYGMALGLLQGIKTMEEARQRLQRLVQNLKSSCLLLDGRMAEEFTMHDVIRDIAASIASRDRHMFFMRNEIGPRELPDAGMLKKCSAISLIYNDFINLPDELDCPQLKYFQLYNKNSALKIPDQFFMRTKALEVLDLKGLQLLSLPSSLGLLEDVLTLCLESCLLQDLSMAGKLKKLGILSLYSSIIEELPKEIGQLTQLRLLNLDSCSELRVIPPNVISNLSQLEELYIGNSFARWDDEQRAAGHASLGELKHLPCLTSLNLQIPDSRNMPKELFSEKLQRFRILIGETWDWSDKHETSRMLKLKLTEGIHINYGVQMLLKKTEDLYLDELKRVRNVLYELDDTGKGFPQLKHLHVQNGSEMKHIINSIEAPTLEAFPVLESLCLQNLINLEKICNGPLKKQPFEKLRVVKVRSCHRLKNLFSFSVARGLLQLQEIEMVDCKDMVEIIAEGGESDIGENGATTKIEFRQLQLLTLKQVPKLISFNTSGTTMALFNQRVTFPNLQDLKLSSISTSQIWHAQLLSVPSCFQNLTTMTVEGCGNLKFLLSSSTVKNLKQLIHLEISECKLIEEIIEEISGEEGMEEMSFPKLNSLKMKGLPKLARFCSAKGVEFPSLKQLQIEYCPKLETFISKCVKKEMRAMKGRQEMVLGIQPLFNEKVAFPSLEKLTISHLKSLTMMWNNQLPEDSFCKLKTMEVAYCEKLQTIFPFSMVRRFQTLETLVINDAGSLEEVFEVQGLYVEENEAEAAVPLKKLYMYNLPKLKHVWSEDPKGTATFQNLNFVYAFGCHSLKYLFPASVARGLQQLEKVEIDASAVEEIVAKDETPQPETRFLFTELSFLRLWNLYKLKNFYHGMHSVEWPALKKFVSYHCGDLKTFTSELLSIEETSRVSQPLFLVEKVVPNLEELSLNSDDISILSHEVFPANLFSKIKVLQVHCYHQDSAIFPFRFIQKFTNLEKLDIDCCEFRDLFPSGEVEDEENHPRTLARVRSLKLVSLPNLSHIWQLSSRADLVLPLLEALVISHCSNLVNLAPSASSFSYLTTLDVWNCHGPENIVASSTAKSLVQLTRMSIRECNKVTEIIVDDEEEETPKEIIFSNLVCLELNGLPSLLYFSSGSSALKFPSLEDVTVKQCPNLRYFHWGELSTPKLHKVWLTEEKDRSCWEGDLNAIATSYDTSGRMISGTRDYDHLEKQAASYSIRDE
ncbi:PREDICTED: disease resistance protein At4g27190 [Theobroma cacao]|uniref:Disease resistance protein At4g27190 n=1 Tax=Theobroma cacao TaxID=3641 RepID=A0AB32WRK2_THECC|nr:PREDICTED: disease resistance protein At4g27190 [Theobroma cacao]